MFCHRYPTDEHYGDAMYENIPNLLLVDDMTEIKTLDILKNDKIVGKIKVEVSLKLKPEF